eukprot:TRINITY_DN17636_c0_g1_i1.p1 TRINITY_DN17636_c0_g1~~TRINITY_DN17636_c0_g1_i1.p1  ORF type:complete len:562 (+),score=188.89 TRINITY_DN17636_c0_g1_i1:175-1686(+)
MYLLGGDNDEPLKSKAEDLESMNIHLLGRSGIKEIKGLSVAFFSGKCNVDRIDELKEMKSLLEDSHDSGVDMLLTTDWPRGIHKGLAPSLQPVLNGLDLVGDDVSAYLCALCKPRYHFASTRSVFYKRNPFTSGAGHVTRFIGLGKVFSEAPADRKWIHALGLKAMKTMDKKALANLPKGTTSSPFVGMQKFDLMGLVDGSKKRGADEINDTQGMSKFAHLDSEHDKKAERYGLKQTSSSALMGAPPTKRGNSVPDDYVCKICNEPGHWIRDCPMKKARTLQKPCWFCLSNPKVERHLIISVGQHCYLALPKGPLCERHVLIIPIQHSPSVAALPAETIVEMWNYVIALHAFFGENNEMPVIFERFLNAGAATHAHLELYPVSKDVSVDEVVSSFERKANQHRIKFNNLPQDVGLADAAGDREYLMLELPGIKRMIHAFGSRLPKDLKQPYFQFGRQVIAEIRDEPSKADWKSVAAVMNREDEEKSATALREAFKKHDFTIMA